MASAERGIAGADLGQGGPNRERKRRGRGSASPAAPSSVAVAEASVYTPPVRRIQLHLDEDLDEALARRARELGIAKAALIRDYLAQHVEAPAHVVDPSARLVGMYEGDQGESAGVDDVVYRQ